MAPKLGDSNSFKIAALVVLAWLCSLSLGDTIVVSVGNFRKRPLFGFGNEFVFQTFNDSGLNNALLGGGGEVSRFPGGTPSDYWLWSEGWVNVSSDRSGCSQLPRRTTNTTNLHSYLQATQQMPILVLNQLQANISYELQGLLAHYAAGTSVSHIELGNEMYDSTRPDVLQEYPEPQDYAIKMADWTKQIKAVFPNSSVALVGLANDWDNRTRIWNEQVLSNPVSSLADAATVHLYPGIPAITPIPASYSSILALLFDSFTGYEAYIQRTIPQRLRIWVRQHQSVLSLLLHSVPVFLVT